MKILKLIYVCLLLLCCHACRNRPYPYTLQAADTLVYDHPDSACTLLVRMKDSILTEPQSTQMYYQLLCIKARDKAYVTHTSDSALLQVLHYYEDRNDKKHLPEAYYYAGRVYSDLKDAPQALNYYQKATELLEGGSDYRLMKVIYSQMGELFFYQDVYEEAMKAFKKAYLYNELLEDDRGMVINLRFIGHTFIARNDIDSALYYYQNAYKLAQKTNKDFLIDISQNALSSLYIQIGEYAQALNLLNAQKHKNTPNNHILLATIYQQTEKLDSAAFYYNLLSNSNNIYTQQTIHRGMAEIAQKHHDCDAAIEHTKQYQILTDSIQRISVSESILKMQSLYNYQLREKANNKLIADNVRQRFWNIIISLILVIISLIFIVYYMQTKQRKKQLQHSLKEIEKLEHTIKLNNQECQSRIAKFKQSEIYNKFHTIASFEELKEEDWIELQDEINATYKNFTSRLYTLYPISKIELRICLLIKADISTSNIALLTGRTKSTITSARKKLYEKVYGQKGDAKMWDDLILSL